MLTYAVCLGRSAKIMASSGLENPDVVHGWEESVAVLMNQSHSISSPVSYVHGRSTSQSTTSVRVRIGPPLIIVGYVVVSRQESGQIGPETNSWYLFPSVGI